MAVVGDITINLDGNGRAFEVRVIAAPFNCELSIHDLRDEQPWVKLLFPRREYERAQKIASLLNDIAEANTEAT